MSAFASRTERTRIVALAAALTLPAATAFPSALHAATAASLSATSLPARGEASAILTVEAAGRYAVTVESAQGTALQLVDRMAGPGEIDGRPGEANGRLDALLDRGRYKVSLFSHEKGEGEAALAVRTFRELHAPGAPLLVAHKPVETSLGDLEQRSWWLDLDADRRVILEAAGRNLSDLRLWRRGGWLVDAPPRAVRLEPAAGRPLRAFRIAARLPQGLYLVTAYGGPSEAWAEGSEAHPLHLRYGIPRLPEAGRRRFAASPFGVDRYLVPARANYFRLELPEALPATLRVEPFDEGSPFGGRGTRAAITKKSRLPAAEITGGGASGLDLVTVETAAGQPYVLQHFYESDVYRFDRSGRYWISSIHGGDPRDSVDATAIVDRRPHPAGHYRPFLSQVISVGRGQGWARRCNLLGELTVHLRVEETGVYEILSRGTEALFRIEPFAATVSPPRRYRAPEFRPAGEWDLDAGYYVLTARPVKPGILEAAVRRRGLLAGVWDLLKEEAVRARPVRPVIRFGEVTLDYGSTYTIHRNRQPGVHAGFLVRPLPLDIEEALPLALLPGEEVEVPVAIARAGALAAAREDGAPLALSLDGGPWGESAGVAPGTHRVRVRHDGDATVIGALSFAPRALREETPLPALDPGRLPPLPDFAALTEGAPAYFDLARKGERTFLVTTGGPAFFRVESTGLLATEGTLRTRVIPILARDAGSGTGRNFFVGAYLREGKYQLTVRALERSAGHLGLRLARAPVRDGGLLREGLPARATLEAGEGIRYDFEVAEAGEYRLEAAALGRALAGRLEDGEGWPLTMPGEAVAYARRRFPAGRYRLFLMPETVRSRRVTTFERLPAPAAFEGHGPHPLPLDLKATHRWREPESDGARVPDRWDFTLPAAVKVDVTLDAEMRGELLRREGDAFVDAGAVFAGRPWSGRLEEGAYRLEVVCSRRNDRVDYRVAVVPAALVDGLSRRVRAPGRVAVAVGSRPFVEIASAGGEDVRARLLDGEGRPLGASDDRAHDWNFRIARSLPPGGYTLEVDPVGSARATTTVSVRALRERAAPPLVPGEERTLEADGDVTLVPLDLPGGEGLLLLGAEARGEIGAVLEEAVGDGFARLAAATGERPRLFVPLGGGTGRPLRLRLWSADRIPREARLHLRFVRPPATGEEAAAGVALAVVPGLAGPLGAARLDLRAPGFFRVTGGRAPWWSPGPGRPLAPVDGLVFAAGARAWLVDETGADGGAPSLRRFFLAPGDAQLLPLPAEGWLRCDLAGEGILLAVARSRAGEPGLSLGKGAATAVAPRAAAALIDAGGPAAASLWRADGAGEAGETRLSLRRFDRPEVEEIRAGTASMEVPAGSARRASLPRGLKRLRVALSRGTAALLDGGGEEGVLLWADGGNRDVLLETEARRFTAVNPGDAPGRVSLEAVPAEKGDRRLAVAPSRPFEARLPHSGTLRLSVEAGGRRGDGASPRLRVAGAVEEAVFVGAGGEVRRGTGVDLAAGGGTLLLRHGPGLVLAWREGEGDGDGLWGDARPRRVAAVRPPASIELEGAAAGVRVAAAPGRALHLRSERPVVTRTTVRGEVRSAGFHPAGVRLDLPPAGEVEVWLRPAAGARLAGRLYVSASPVEAIGEGLGPEVLLAPGQSRLFSLAVEREGPLGFGVRAEADVVLARLLDAGGGEIARGAVGMAEVAPGTLYLSLEAPVSGEAVRARPALAGIEPPGDGPPAEVIRQYLQAAREGRGE